MNAVWKWARIGVCPMTATGRISGGPAERKNSGAVAATTLSVKF